LGTDADSLTVEEAAEMLASNPKAMHRPLFKDDQKVFVGFKPEELNSLIS
jgi:arsenate reductase-like glutaredoxin family protein